MNNIPKVKIERCNLIENNYIVDGKKYSAIKLIEHSKNFNYFELPLASINLRTGAWGIEDIDDFIFQVNRVKNADLKYPILLDQYGTICDGWHRICKAILTGRKTIKAIRLESMPDPDSVEDVEG